MRLRRLAALQPQPMNVAPHIAQFLSSQKGNEYQTLLLTLQTRNPRKREGRLPKTFDPVWLAEFKKKRGIDYGAFQDSEKRRRLLSLEIPDSQQDKRNDDSGVLQPSHSVSHSKNPSHPVVLHGGDRSDRR